MVPVAGEKLTAADRTLWAGHLSRGLTREAALEGHHARLQAWATERLQAAGALEHVMRDGFQPVCAQYSPPLQLGILGLELHQIRPPVLDIAKGCLGLRRHVDTRLRCRCCLPGARRIAKAGWTVRRLRPLPGGGGQGEAERPFATTSISPNAPIARNGVTLEIGGVARRTGTPKAPSRFNCLPWHPHAQVANILPSVKRPGCRHPSVAPVPPRSSRPPPGG